MSSYSESELILPSLYLMDKSTDGTITTTDLITGLRQLLKPSGDDLNILKGRNDDKFSQKVRNIVSHKKLEKLGFTVFSNSVHKITTTGLEFLNNPLSQQFIKEKLTEEFEGEDSLDINPTSYEKVNDEQVYPYTSLNIERTQFSVYELKRKFEKIKLVLDPDFQRQKVWSRLQMSELIESILMNIPLPYIYLSENKFGDLYVIDGRQRLTALFEFIDNRFKLDKRLQILRNIADKKFSELDPLLQSIIEDYQMTSQIIKPPVSDRVLIDIFERVNRSGTLLNSQEIRNALYQGPVTKLLNQLSELQIFKEATGNSIKSERMRDKYLITRFLSFYVWRKYYVQQKDNRIDDLKYDYRSDVEDFLGRYMDFINSMGSNELLSLSDAFNRSMTITLNVLGDNAFRLPNIKDPNKKRPINMALFESLGYLMSHDQVLKNKELFLNLYSNLLNDESFLKSFLSIDSSVKFRFEKMDEILNQI